MIRFLGFMTGVTLTIGVMLLVMGPPQFTWTQAAQTAQAKRGPQPIPVATPLEIEPAPAITPSAPEPQPMPEEQRWYSFWNPFRSEIAANGFVTRLRAVTSIDYRVVRLEPGRYQVAFAYVDDAERHSNISLIETATGLSLPEESP